MIQHDLVRRRARLLAEIDLLEEVERGQAPAGAVDKNAVVGVAFVEAQLAADHLVERAHVAD